MGDVRAEIAVVMHILHERPPLLFKTGNCQIKSELLQIYSQSKASAPIHK